MQLFSQPPRTSLQPVAIPETLPVYRIKEGKFYADDELFEAGSIITWTEEPNLEMHPLNELARKAMSDYLDKLDMHGREAAKAAGKSYVSYKDAFENSMSLAQKQSRRVELLNGTEEVPIMGGKQKGPRKAQTVDLAPQEEVIVRTPKKNSDGRNAVNSADAKGLI